MPAYTVADAFVAWDSKLLGKHTQLKLNVKTCLTANTMPPAPVTCA